MYTSLIDITECSLMCMSVGLQGLFNFLLDFEVVVVMITLAG